MRSKVWVISVGLVFVFIISGCDNFSFTKKKNKNSEEKTVTTPVVTGTIVAKVNNYPITLEDLN